MDDIEYDIKIKILAIGDDGINAIRFIQHTGLAGIDYIAIDIKEKEEKESPDDAKTPLYLKVESHDKIAESLRGANVIFIMFELTNEKSVELVSYIGKISKEIGALSIAIINTSKLDKTSILLIKDKLQNSQILRFVDTALISFAKGKTHSIVIPQQSKDEKTILYFSIFKIIKSIVDLFKRPGIINLDFADIRLVLAHSGIAFWTIGYSKGENKTTEAAEIAISNLSLDEYKLNCAGSILVNITGSKDLTIMDVNDILETIYSEAGETPNIVFGAVIDGELKNEVYVSIISSGYIKNIEKSKENIPHLHYEKLLATYITPKIKFNLKEENAKEINFDIENLKSFIEKKQKGF